ncbi:HAMP domain-containing methyl-accepting chemotaxis protein [Halodesulfovibrio sp.]|uniref:methyl-accepting chemotaxis protein n=1 Tax=Halodesulfovibrio sp. TaxID=1912772 RepID=UPI0025C4CA60|nr:HAMP domain-containing methyl-accepting chemotaxis protein [Halodesulfovibrio sp.]
MQFRLQLAHKLTGAFGTLLLCALLLGGMAFYALSNLSASMEARTSLDEVLALGQDAQAAAFDWLAHREELTMTVESGDTKMNPLVHYQVLTGRLEKRIKGIRAVENPRIDLTALSSYETAFAKFDRAFAAFQQDFNSGTEMVKGLRESSIGILGKAQSLQKAVTRKRRKVINRLHRLEKKAAQRGGLSVQESQELLKITEEMQALTAQNKVAALLLNKPLGFQEMAKDFILYKDDASGRGLIVDMEKLLGIDKDASMGQSLPQLAPMFPSGREAKVFKKITELTEAYLDAFKGYFAMNQKMHKAMQEMVLAKTELRDLGTSIRERGVKNYLALQADATSRMLGVVLFVTFVSVILLYMNIRFVVVPIKRMVGQIASIGELIAGGAKDELPRIEQKGQDELAELAQSFNAMMDVIEINNREIAKATAHAEEEARAARSALDSLQETQAEAALARREGTLNAVGSLERIVESLVVSSDALSDQIAGVTEKAEELQQRTTESATSLTEMSSTVHEVARSSSNAAQSAEEVMSTAQSGALVVDGAMKAIFGVRTQTDNLKESLEGLNERATDISQIMSVINDIADQTNLLALNAAIEAARAGDAGRGFAVVADEVRKLAEKTMQATQDVGQSIKAIQMSARENVQGMVSADSAVSDSTQLAEKAEEALQKIVGFAENSSSQVHNIAAAVEEQSASTEQIGDVTEHINVAAHSMAKTLIQSNEATSHLKQLAGDLEGLIISLKGEC